jgi:antitoxin PrlF
MSAKIAPCSESTLTERYQTTVPAPIRKILGLSKNDKICYTIESNGVVIISRVEPVESDPILGQFLSFLAEDLTNNPRQIRSIDPILVDRVRDLVCDVEFDIDEPLSDEDE